MKLLVIDGNSILNRAFYGIKALATKDGRFTNGIYGFLSILTKLKEMCAPDGVAVAFDLKAPTFRHEMYAQYKAGRHKMPDELAQQMQPLKELLNLLGCKTLEAEGWEADDILGTLAQCCRRSGDECFIATGDRDSLQLAHGGVKVLLASTKAGQPVTTVYDEDKLLEEYGVSAAGMIQVKALMGDSSDNIPGVTGVGQKTAFDLIQRFHTLDEIYAGIDSIDIKKGVREKLIRDREQAYLSLELGTIRTDAPVSCNVNDYVQTAGDPQKAAAMLISLEMFRMIDKLGLQNVKPAAAVQETSAPLAKRKLTFTVCENAHELFSRLENGRAYFCPSVQDGEAGDLWFACGDAVTVLKSGNGGYPAFVKRFFEDGMIEKYTHNVKPLYRKAEQMGIRLENVKMDTMLAGYLLNPSASSYEAARLMSEYGVDRAEYKDENEEDGICETVETVASMEALCEKMAALIAENGQEMLLHEVEIPLSRVLARMEHEGFLADADGITAFSKKLQGRIDEITGEIFGYVGYEFNLNSPKQLGEALFVKLALPAKKKTKSGYSTNADVLESLEKEHPVIPLILEYRTLAKLKSTYCDGLLKVIGPDGRIHTSFNQVETRTGRISSTEPNLQNIPVRSELGREMRKFFVAKAGCVLVDADYSQIELRVLADLADDINMIEAFNNGDDIHSITASQVFNLPMDMVTSTMRSRAKAVNFGIVYGIGAFSLAKDINVPVYEAKSYINGYLEHYVGVKNYMDKIIASAKACGYSQTLFGRRRYLPELAASNAVTRAFGERVARNMPIQGTAADIIKIAMVKVDQRLSDEKMASKLILQVHDELIVEATVQEAQKVLDIVTQEMENACKMKVKLRADGNIGKTWYDAKG